jgi:hypothetical protein
MIEGLPPVTRERIFWMAGLERKFAVWLASRPNSLKLWKRFAPSLDVLPPLMLKRVPPLGFTTVAVPSAAGTIGCAWTLDAKSNNAKDQRQKYFLLTFIRSFFLPSTGG